MILNKDKVLARFPDAEVEHRDGKGRFSDKFYITAENDYISDGFETIDEAWTDAARRLK